MIQKTNYRLTSDAIARLKHDNELCLDVANTLGVTIMSFPMYVKRNSRRLLQHPIPDKIAIRMGKQVSDIIEEQKAVA
jgi:hypothetical protein